MGTTWSLLLVGLGLLLALAGMVVAWRALFADRSRGRPRCPKCWYDMAGLVGEPARFPVVCPECGCACANVGALGRTRRSWRWAGAGAVLVVAGLAAGRMSEVGKYGAASVLPTEVILWLVSDTSLIAGRTPATSGVAPGRLMDELVRRAEGRALSAAERDRIAGRILRAAPLEVLLPHRARWPVGVPLLLEPEVFVPGFAAPFATARVRLRGSTDVNTLRQRARATPRLYVGGSRTMNNPRWQDAPTLPTNGCLPVDIDLIEENGVPGTGRVVASRRDVVRVEPVAHAATILIAGSVQSIDRAFAGWRATMTCFEDAVVLNIERPDDYLRVNPIQRSALRLEVIGDGEVLASAMVWRDRGMLGHLSPFAAWSPDAATVLATTPCSEWHVRLTGDAVAAIRDRAAISWAQGTAELPMTVVRKATRSDGLP